MKYGLVIFLLAAVLAFWVWRPVPSITTKTPAVGEKTAEAHPFAPTLPPSRIAVTSEDKSKLAILEDILKLKNDNDPRLDREFRNLSEGTKELFREKYTSLPAELRNEKGTIIFLLGRNLKSEEDFRFLESVLEEPPCYNLSNCQDSSGTPGEDPAHDDMGTTVTLAYPQMVSLKSIENFLNNKDRDRSSRSRAIRVLETGRTSSVKTVATLADQLFNKFREAE